MEPGHMSIWRLYHIDSPLPKPQSLRKKYIEGLELEMASSLLTQKKRFFQLHNR